MDSSQQISAKLIHTFKNSHPLYKALFNWWQPVLWAESANLTVLIALLNMQWETSTGTGSVYLMIWMNKLGQRKLPPVYLEVRLAAHETKLVCTHQSGSYLARQWHMEGWGSVSIRGDGICLNVWPPSLRNCWESTQGTSQTDDYSATCPHSEFFYFSKEWKSKWLSSNKTLLSKDEGSALA